MSIESSVSRRPWLGWVLFLGTVVVVFLIGLFASTIVERRTEALVAYTPSTDIADREPRNEVWGRYFPREYQSYLRTRETTFRSKHNGSGLVDALAQDPNLVVLWAGYSFSKDYNQPRGHAWAVEDIRRTLRTGGPLDGKSGPMPNTCWSCKSPDVPRVMAEIGPAEFYRGTWAARGAEIVNAIGCADCHDPRTMNLRISRPALKEAFERQGKDITTATHQEMRSLVCAQCHVEYYFKGAGNYLTHPWDKGLAVEDMEAYYDAYDFSDWTHGLSRAPMLKAQHPGWELSRLGIHAQRGLACADCHMPYETQGGVKYTNHHVQSPLANIATTCQVCHRESEAVLMANVYERQDKNLEIRAAVERELVHAHVEAARAWEAGAGEAEMKPALTHIRHAQWRWDFAVASHGASFHAPLEVARILSSALEKAFQARLELARVLAAHGVTGPVLLPDLSTKEKAQRYVGLDMEALRREKQEFLEKVVPAWDRAAAEREKGYGPRPPQ
ncbi:MAG: ammonia-forming cytochrome c nitrite reductase [Planctomycetes bacterium]|nr:ammonia-forming cytochrome c nitrite reductase [Planctomycetota bacterium]